MLKKLLDYEERQHRKAEKGKGKEYLSSLKKLCKNNRIFGLKVTFADHLVQPSANAPKLNLKNWLLNFKSCFSCPVFVPIIQEEIEYSASIPFIKTHMAGIWLSSYSAEPVVTPISRK